MNNHPFCVAFPRLGAIALLAGAALALTACGGSDDKKSTSSVSSISSSYSSYTAASYSSSPNTGIWPDLKVTTAATKTLRIEWSPVAGATDYKLWKNEGAGFIQVGNTTQDTFVFDEISVHLHDFVNTRYYVEACNADGCESSDNVFTMAEMLKTIGYLKASHVDEGDFFGWSLALSADGSTLAVGTPADDSIARGVNGDASNNESSNSGAVYVFVKENGLWTQQAYLKASNTEQLVSTPSRFLANDRFGYRVSLSDDGNTLAVSAINEDGYFAGINCNQDNYELELAANGNQLTAYSNDTGAVYVFTRTDATWNQEAYIKSTYLHNSLIFGETLALSGDGNTLAVGSTQDSQFYAGVINNTSAEAECVNYIPSSTSSSVSLSTSSSVSSTLSSSTSSGVSYFGGDKSGGVQIFSRSSSGWKAEAAIKPNNAQYYDQFGAAIALSTNGNVLLAGAPGEDSQAVGVNGNATDNSCYVTQDPLVYIDLGCQVNGASYLANGINNGAAYVFIRENGGWKQTAYLKPSHTFVGTNFGSAVALSGSGDLAVIGAKGDTIGKFDSEGKALISSDTSISLQTLGRELQTGRVYLFKQQNGTWTQAGELTASRPRVGVEFGQSVAVAKDGSTIAVSTYRDASTATGINGDEGNTDAKNAGAVYVFTQEGESWKQKSYVKASNTDSEDRFGQSISLSEDGTTMAVGAHREAGSGDDQSDNSKRASGAVYLY